MIHRENTDWFRKVEKKLEELTIPDDIYIEIKKVRKQVSKMPNSKNPGSNGVLEYWTKKLSNLYTRIAKCPQENNLPK